MARTEGITVMRQCRIVRMYLSLGHPSVYSSHSPKNIVITERANLCVGFLLALLKSCLRILLRGQRIQVLVSFNILNWLASRWVEHTYSCWRYHKYIPTRLHENFVIVPADKASNNFTFVCKRYYVSILIEERGLNSLPVNPKWQYFRFCCIRSAGQPQTGSHFLWNR